MRPLSRSAPVLEALLEAPDVVTPSWIMRACTVSRRQALDAIKVAVRHGMLTHTVATRGEYRLLKTRAHVCLGG